MYYYKALGTVGGLSIGLGLGAPTSSSLPVSRAPGFDFRLGKRRRRQRRPGLPASRADSRAALEAAPECMNVDDGFPSVVRVIEPATWGQPERHRKFYY